MSESTTTRPNFAILPSVHDLLEKLTDQTSQIDPVYLKKIITGIIVQIKEHPDRYKLEKHDRRSVTDLILARTRQSVKSYLAASPEKVINGTGVILHTGLGRAPAGYQAGRISDAVSGYTNLEIRLDSGKRGERADHVASLLHLLTDAQDAVVVNNNAAAVLLMLNSIARRKEVIVSRGELVEIGGSFRMPEVMKSSGAKMVEVGATNKTHLEDYAGAINDKTAAILLVHPSNYQIIGFSAKPDSKDIVALAHKHDIPVIFDVGSGALIDMREFGLEYEPVIPELVNQGFDLISFSGDKLLGGPQAGIIVGSQYWLKRIKQNHLLRALRCDKFILGLLAETLRGYLHSGNLPDKNQTIALFKRPVSVQKKIAEKIISGVRNKIDSGLEIIAATGKAGSGAYPVSPINTVAIRFSSDRISAEQIAKQLRAATTPVFSYIEENACHLSMLAIFEEDVPGIISAIRTLQ